MKKMYTFAAMEEDEELYREMNQEDPYYMGPEEEEDEEDEDEFLTADSDKGFVPNDGNTGNPLIGCAFLLLMVISWIFACSM